MRRLLLAALVAFGCSGGDSPTAPTPRPRAPVEVWIDSVAPNPVVVGEFTYTTYRLSGSLRHRVEIPVETITPAGDQLGVSTILFAVETTMARYSGPLPYAGDWVTRILGDELPEGVVLGEPYMVTVTATEPD